MLHECHTRFRNKTYELVTEIAGIPKYLPNFRKKTAQQCKKIYFEQKIRSAVNVKIITHLFVLKNALSDGRCINPGDKVLHVAGHDEGRVLDHIRANSNMTLLDELS